MKPQSQIHIFNRIFRLRVAKFARVISGDKQEFTIENRIFNVATLVAFIAVFVGVFWNHSIGLPLVLNIFTLSFLFIFLILFYFSRFKQKYNSTVFVIITLIGLSLQWIGTEGSMGSIPMLYVIAIVAFISISTARFHIRYLIFTLVNIMVLYALEKLYFEEIFFAYPSDEAAEKDVFFGFLVGLILCYIIMSFFKSRYDVEKRRLEDQSIELQELNATKDKFFSIISHDLRGPFSSILGFTQVMSDPQRSLSEDQYRKYAGRINESAENAFDLLENLLAWGRINQGLIPFEPKNVLLNPLVQSCIKPLVETSKAKDISLSVQIPDSVEVYADYNMLQSVIRNLVSNGIKFTNAKGSVNISAKMTRDRRVEISTIDSGIGMSKEIMQDLYLLKAQTGRKGTEGEASIGLGLLICKELLAKMDSEILVESEINKGSCFKFSLPLSKASENELY